MIDNTLRRVLVVVVSAGLIVGLIVLLPSLVGDNYGDTLHNYLRRLSENDAQSAYEMLCSESRAQISAAVFNEKLQTQLQDIGDVKSIDNLRGDDDVGYNVIVGTRRSILVITPMKKEAGQWRPCPSNGPFGEPRPYP